jgi:hypothetical protein
LATFSTLSANMSTMKLTIIRTGIDSAAWDDRGQAIMGK